MAVDTQQQGRGVDHRPERDTARRIALWGSGTNLLLGAWLVIAPAVLGYTAVAQAFWDDIAVGAAVGILAYGRFAGRGWPQLSALNGLLGLWLVIAPWALGFDDVGDATVNDVIVGSLVLFLAAASWLADRWYAPGARYEPPPHSAV